MKKTNPIFLFMVSFLCMLPTYNKGWAPFDEGNYLTTALFVLKGMVPYKDFFVIMYPPGQAYTLAALLKIFGMNIMAGRFYNIALLSIISVSVYSVAKKVTSGKCALIAFIVCLVTMAALGEPPIPRAVWPGVASSMLATLFIIDFIQKEKLRYLISSSLFVALTTFYRHDIGALTFLAGAAGLAAIRGRVKYLALYAAAPAISIAAFIIWLYKAGAARDAYEAIIILPSMFNKWAAIPFPRFCASFPMIFHRGCLFIRQNKFYIPIIVCGVSALLYFMRVASKRVWDRKDISVAVILMLGIFYLQQLVFRVDDNHLAASLPPSCVLFGLMLGSVTEYRNRFINLLKAILISYVSGLMVLFMYHDIERYVKDVYIKPFVTKSIEPVKFKHGTLYIPDDGRETFAALVRYVERNTKPGERIYVGHLRHKVPQWGWFDLIYFLTERLPAVKHYILIPGFQMRDDIQEAMARSLKENRARLLLLRDYGEINELGPLDRYIRAEYRLEKIIDSYHIYVKR